MSESMVKTSQNESVHDLIKVGKYGDSEKSWDIPQPIIDLSLELESRINSQDEYDISMDYNYNHIVSYNIGRKRKNPKDISHLFEGQYEELYRPIIPEVNLFTHSVVMRVVIEFSDYSKNPKVYINDRRVLSPYYGLEKSPVSQFDNLDSLIELITNEEYGYDVMSVMKYFIESGKYDSIQEMEHRDKKTESFFIKNGERIRITSEILNEMSL